MEYVFFGPNFRPAFLLYKEALDLDNVMFLKSPFRMLQKSEGCGNGWQRYVFWAARTIRMPEVLKKKLFEIPKITDGVRACFIFHNPWIEYCMRSGYLKLLRAAYPDGLFVANLLDAQLAKDLDLPSVKANYDRVFIYDKTEARQMGIDYQPAPYSKLFEITSDGVEPEYDVSWIGVAKGRLAALIEVYDYLSSKGISCRFYVVGVRPGERIERPGITYGNKFLSDEDSFSYTSSSRCLLELGLPKTKALTSRVREAIVYDKKILTDNSKLLESDYYKEDMMQVYTCVNNIDTSFFKRKGKGYYYRGEFSPVSFLYRLEKDCGRKDSGS